MTTATIRPATPADLDTVLAIETAGFATTDQWSADAWAAELTGDRIVLLADGDGVISWQLVADLADLLRVVVRPEARGRGIARDLVATGLREMAARGARRVLLEVEADNHPAISLYRGFDFTEIDRRRGYYGAGRDASIMELSIGGNTDD